jgi:anthranilate phosphoribosyltransferase
MDLLTALRALLDGASLSAADAESAVGHLMSGEASSVQIAAFLVALRAKGHTADEVAGGVRALRKVMLPVAAPQGNGHLPLVDTCGTGGGALTTLNLSTAAALVAAGAGVRVAKHGNRSFTSRSGSADVLEALGVRIDLTPEAMAQVLDEAGIVFMFAPLLHPAMRHVGPVRRELGIPTIMNLLGPLTNPAGVRRQVVGVSDSALIPLVVGALQALGHERAMVVHGAPGIDELSPLGTTEVAALDAGSVRTFTVNPDELGLEPSSPEDLAGGEPADNASRIVEILEGRERGGARQATLLNAAAALWVGGVVEDLSEGLSRAAASVDSGAAASALDRLRASSNREGKG